MNETLRGHIIRVISCITIGLAVGLSSACSILGICVGVSDASAQRFVINVADQERNCKEPAVVTGLQVRQVEADGIVFWNIASPEGEKLDRIRYGEVPPGFQGSPALPLIPGERVNISVKGRGTSGGTDVTIAP